MADIAPTCGNANGTYVCELPAGHPRNVAHTMLHTSQGRRLIATWADKYGPVSHRTPAAYLVRLADGTEIDHADSFPAARHAKLTAIYGELGTPSTVHIVRTADGRIYR